MENNKVNKKSQIKLGFEEIENRMNSRLGMIRKYKRPYTGRQGSVKDMPWVLGTRKTTVGR